MAKFTNNKIVNFLSFWVINTVVLLIASAVFGQNIVLGSANITGPLAAVVSGLILTLVVYAVPIAVDRAGLKKTMGNTPAVWAGIFLVSNFVVVWVIKRFADFSGLGVSNLLYVLVLAVLITLVGWGVAKVTGAMSLK